MYTSRATKIITPNTEKANFQDIIAFNYRQGIYQVKIRQGDKGNPKAARINLLTWEPRHVPTIKFRYANYPTLVYLPSAFKDNFLCDVRQILLHL